MEISTNFCTTFYIFTRQTKEQIKSFDEVINLNQNTTQFRVDHDFN